VPLAEPFCSENEAIGTDPLPVGVPSRETTPVAALGATAISKGMPWPRVMEMALPPFSDSVVLEEVVG
jgi:hypothetical protein